MASDSEVTKLIFFFNWRVITLQCCVGFCHITMWTSLNFIYIYIYMYMYRYVYMSSPSWAPLFPPISPLWVITECQAVLLMLYSFPLAIHSTHVSFSSIQFSRSVISDSATPWSAAHQASLSITNSQSLFKLTSIKSVMPSNHLLLRPSYPHVSVYMSKLLSQFDVPSPSPALSTSSFSTSSSPFLPYK